MFVYRLLNCYLERDLLLNGGRLAEVVFVVHTEINEVRMDCCCFVSL